jgi:putative hydrolase of the HAD superfamily
VKPMLTAEQNGKIERSGIKQYFAATEVVAEKNAATYANITEKYSCDRSTTWMIGNSPKSDINPTLAAGLHAIFVPHGDTWILEHEEVNPAPPSQKLLIVGRFGELREYFECSFSAAARNRSAIGTLTKPNSL